MAFEGFPLVVGWELTLRCNLRCEHCASSAGRARQRELSVLEALDICEQLPALLVQEVDLTGGEPLLQPYWPEVANRLVDLGVKTKLVTNGVLLQDNAVRIADVGIRAIAISIDGLENTHDQNRKFPGLFQRILKGIDAASRAGLSVAAITAVHDGNLGELEELYTLLSDVGVRQWQVQPTFALGRALGRLALSSDTYLSLGQFIADCRNRQDQSGVEVIAADGVGYCHSPSVRAKPWTGCGAGLASCGITSEGRIKGCLSLPDSLVEGDLRERALWDIWFAEESFVTNRRFSRGMLGEHCKHCQHGDLCKGGCWVMSYAATGQAHNNPYCFSRLLAATS